jgi:menaquinone-9 beta-reductase
MKSHRVIIVGAGPAGCIAGTVLGSAGLETIILERGAPGKDKACGDAFVPAAVEILARFGFDHKHLTDLGGLPFDGIEIHREGGVLERVLFEEQHLGWILPRSNIDQALRDSASRVTSITYKTNVISLEIRPDKRLSVRARDRYGDLITVIADAIVLAVGANNLIPRQWNICGDPWYGVSISAYLRHGTAGRPCVRLSSECQPGYQWSFPVNSTMSNIGVCLFRCLRAKSLRMLGSKFLTECNVTESVRWRGGVGTLWSGMGHMWHLYGGIISCGDAAGLVDPFTGEGLTAALISGEKAGHTMVQYLRSGRNPEVLDQYSHWIVNYFAEKYSMTPLRKAWTDLCGSLQENSLQP